MKPSLASVKRDELFTIESHWQDTLKKDDLCLKVVEKIEELYLWFSPQSTREAMMKRLRQHPDARIDLLIELTTGKCAGFSVHYTEEFQGKRVMYRGGTIVRDRSQGFYKRLLAHTLTPRIDFVVAMTQNPRVYESLRSLSPVGLIYPNSGRPAPKMIQEIAAKFCRAPIDLSTMIVKGVYDDIRKEDNFKTNRDPQVLEMFSLLKEDDGFFVVVPLSA